MPNKEKIIHRDVLLSTIFTFILLCVVKLVILNTEYLNPIAQVFEDFQFTDLYYSEFRKPKTEIDTNLVVINIGENDRAGIVRQLLIVESYHPRAIGLDVTFKERKDEATDSLLKAALNGTVPVISVSNIIYNEEDPKAAFDLEKANPYFGMANNEGFGNFLGEQNQTIRYYVPFLEKEGHKYPAFTTKLLQRVDSGAYAKLEKHHKKSEIINYRAGSFAILDANDLNEKADLNFLRNKIVLMGYMGPDFEHKVFEDNHLTPLNKSYGGMALPDKYGIEIHANIISMVLNESYVHEMPKWSIYVIAFLVCMLHMYVFIHLFVNHHKWFHIGAISLQIVSFAFIVAFSLILFHVARLKFEPALIVVGVILSVESLYFYEGIVKFLHKEFNFQSCFAQSH